jgi:GNAT superfamily N-acetyltransferase
MARETLEWAKNPDVFSGGVFGLFREGLLCGFVDGDLYPEVGITTVDLFVNRQHRGQGYARRLLNAFCSRPGTVYCYSCVKTNLASYRTALSCGFRKVGEYLLIV